MKNKTKQKAVYNVQHIHLVIRAASFTRTLYCFDKICKRRFVFFFLLVHPKHLLLIKIINAKGNHGSVCPISSTQNLSGLETGKSPFDS